MKNKTQNTEKKTLKKQLISGGVYIALSAVAVAVTVNTAVSMLSSDDTPKPLSLTPDSTDIVLPSVPEELVLPSYDSSLYNSLPGTTSEHTPVADIPSGISAEVVEDTSDTENISMEDTGEVQFDIAEISSNANLGEDSFVKPCNGFVTVEHSLGIPVYSPTLGDYRTHTGIDIAADKNAVVSTVKGGVITEIYTDDLYGHSLKLETPDGYTFIYSNLSMPLSDGIAEGTAVTTSTVLGCIGDSAISEIGQESHLHFEMYKDNEAVNPCDFIDF
jgi:hypothetical protein